ncbi:MAG: ECF transporter S component [Muribaculaceae bacterium]|nr:ECF transporter S component [Muribaculaceae bacterium]MBQ3910137.1 ECF transporter S component [Muribaculaceae bacterium]MBQ6648017.1 ECF transporter S component [Muribaculaceae bacterium]
MKSSAQNVALYQLSYSQLKTYLIAAAFIVGNIALPQLCHLMPQGGLIFLPIYFFTLVAAYKYGFTVGLTTAVLSPLVNSALFGMPPAAALPIILIKSVTLAVAAAWIARKTSKVTLLTVALAVIAYQLIGSLAEWAMTGSIEKASQDIVLGWPGCLIQIVGGYLVLRYLLRK